VTHLPHPLLDGFYRRKRCKEAKIAVLAGCVDVFSPSISGDERTRTLAMGIDCMIPDFEHLARRLDGPALGTAN
jgi:hypothetical protein